jgi:CheY-like chemotaxis protein
MGQEYRGPKRTILCIDDDSSILKYERSLFEKSGYDVLTTLSAYQGLALATHVRLDAVVLDYQMPEMSGHEVAFAIRKRRPEIRIVMLSASEIPKETIRLADAVVLKTDAVLKLVPTVQRVCDQASPS